MSKEFKYDLSKEAKLTNEQLAEELSKHSALSAKRVQDILPEKEDKKKLGELIEIVNRVASQNEKVADLRSNFEKLGGVILKLLKTVI
jgi:hypothetical protein